MTFQQSLTGRGGAGNTETTSTQRLEEARASLQREKAILAQHQQEMRRHEKLAVGRGGAGNLQRKKKTTIPKESGFPGAQVGSRLFKTVTRSSRSSSERSVIDIRRTGKITLKLLLAWQPDSTQDLKIMTLTVGRLRTRR